MPRISEEARKARRAKKGKHVDKKTDNLANMVERRNSQIDDVKLEAIEEEIKNQNFISEKRRNKINKRLFTNLVIACIIVLYFIFIILGYLKVEPVTYIIDLRVFSMITIGITIIIFEKAYNKDSDELAIYGIESLVLAISTLMTRFVINSYEAKYVYIMNSISMLFAVYYVGKCIIIYLRMSKKSVKRVRDIQKVGRIIE